MGYPTPEMRERMRNVRPGTPPAEPAGASSARTDQEQGQKPTLQAEGSPLPLPPPPAAPTKGD